MNSAPDMTGRNDGLCRQAASRLVAMVLALLLAFSFPAVSSGAELSDSQVPAVGYPVAVSLAIPDVTVLTPAVESDKEFDRFKNGTSPAILGSAPDTVRPVITAIGVVYVAFDTTALRSAVILPPGRGPPPSFPHA